jgi:hypothetical protein
MHNQLIPLLVIFVLPALYLGQRLGLFGRRPARWMAGALLGLAIVLSLPFEGLDLVQLKRVKLLLAAATALMLLLRHLKVSWALDPARYRGFLAVLAALSAVTYLNFFAFHGARTFVHLHDVAHYYLGAKYYAELGQQDLYVALLRAEAESTGNRFKAIEARDLDSYELVHIRSLLAQSDPVKAAFGSERWTEFQRDAAWFRDALGPHYAAVLRDHGFNATPGWAFFGAALAGLVPAGSDTGILLLTLLDPLLLVGMFGMIAWAFGLDAMLLALIYLSLLFGAGFGWTGGGFLRMPWLAATVGAVCCYQRRYRASAGALLAVAVLLRIFPAFFALPFLFRAIAAARRWGSVPRRYVRFFAGFAITGAVLFAATALLPRGWSHWIDLRTNLEAQLEVTAPNLVGLTQLIAYRSSEDEVSREEIREIQARRRAIHHVQLWVVFLPLLALAAWGAPRERDLGVVALGVPLIFVGLNLAAYYYAFLVVLVLAHRDDPERLALLFGVEVASYVLMLFEDSEGLLHVQRSALVGALILALYVEPLRGLLRPSPAPQPRRAPIT